MKTLFMVRWSVVNPQLQIIPTQSQKESSCHSSKLKRQFHQICNVHKFTRDEHRKCTIFLQTHEVLNENNKKPCFALHNGMG
jgi:hypothetical protein